MYIFNLTTLEQVLVLVKKAECVLLHVSLNQVPKTKQHSVVDAKSILSYYAFSATCIGRLNSLKFLVFDKF